MKTNLQKAILLYPEGSKFTFKEGWRKDKIYTCLGDYRITLAGVAVKTKEDNYIHVYEEGYQRWAINLSDNQDFIYLN